MGCSCLERGRELLSAKSLPLKNTRPELTSNDRREATQALTYQ